VVCVKDIPSDAGPNASQIILYKISDGTTTTIAGGGAVIDTMGNNVTFANSIGNNGAGVLIKTNTGSLTLLGTNTYGGDTIVAGGTLAIGSDAALGTSGSYLSFPYSAVLQAAGNNVAITNCVFTDAKTWKGYRTPVVTEYNINYNAWKPYDARLGQGYGAVWTASMLRNCLYEGRVDAATYWHFAGGAYGVTADKVPPLEIEAIASVKTCL